MSPFSHSHINPAVVLLGLPDPLAPGFWTHLYKTGQFGPEGGPNLAMLILTRIVIVAGIFILARILVAAANRLITRGLSAMRARSASGNRRLDTLHGLLTSTLAYGVYFFAIILTLFSLGATWKSLAPLLGAASVLGLAIGFGAQRLIRDVITGLFLLGEGQFDVGDWVTIGAVTGRVEEIGLRVTRIREEQGRMYVIANGDITQVFNASRGLIKLSIDFSLSRAVPLDNALERLRDAAVDVITARGAEGPDLHERVMLKVIGMDAAKVTIRLVVDVPASQRDATEDALRRRVLATSDEETVQLA